MRISDWSSDVCSSDLLALGLRGRPGSWLVLPAGRRRDGDGEVESDLTRKARQQPGGKTRRRHALALQHPHQGGSAQQRATVVGKAAGGAGQAIEDVDAGLLVRKARVRRSEERRVGKERVRTGRSRGSPYT